MANIRNILTAVLNKLGKKYEDLSSVAKTTYDRWEVILNAGPVTIEKLKPFLAGEREALIKELVRPQVKLNSEEDMFLKARITDCEVILALLESPQKAAAMLEAYLKKLHKIK
jgi:NAD-dependent DNA ligase